DSKSTDWFSVDLETAEIVGRAKSISLETDGLFDVTVAPLVKLWKFGSQDGEAISNPPTPSQIAEAMKLVGSDKIEVQLDPPALKKQHADMRIDLSAIAKGYAVDQVASILESNDVSDFMIEIGGEIRVAGNSSKGGAWRIGIESPDRGERNVDSVVSLGDCAIATSGDYRNFREINGTIYTHVIDPTTGQSVHHDLASVTVIANDCEKADALATALLAKGHDHGKAWAEQHDIDAMFLRRSDGKILHSYTGDFPAVETKPDQASRSFAGEFFQVAAIAGLIFGIAVIAMSVGTIFSNRRLTGSCGGLAAVTDEQGKTVCELCSRPSPDCLGPDEP
ncbi:MAG: FAD:protein FMN transferase, partial [Planctomycetota bacterium]